MKYIIPKSERSYPYEEFKGFTQIAEIEWRNVSYAFDITGVWKKEDDGTLWTADDSGCSCPTPWENLDELDRLYNLDELRARYKAESNDQYGSHVNASEWEKFKGIVLKALDDLKFPEGR